jgi:hypothetical protein
LVITDGTSFNDTAATVYAGDPGTNFYTFDGPTVNRAWCSITKTNPVGAVGGSASTVASCSSQPCSQFDMISTTALGNFMFYIETFWDGELLSHTQGPISVEVFCGSHYTFSEVTSAI